MMTHGIRQKKKNIKNVEPTYILITQYLIHWHRYFPYQVYIVGNVIMQELFGTQEIFINFVRRIYQTLKGLIRVMKEISH